MDDAPELAGWFVACPKCGKQFPLAPSAPQPAEGGSPPEAPAAVAVPPTVPPVPSRNPETANGVSDREVLDVLIDASQPPTRRGFGIADGIAKHYRESRKSATKLPKFLLLAATVIWPIATIGCGELRYQMEMFGLKHDDRGDDYYFPDGYWEDGPIVRHRADAAWWSGARAATFAYVAVALSCLAWWFYVKD